jgi:hypothetical protein
MRETAVTVTLLVQVEEEGVGLCWDGDDHVVHDSGTKEGAGGCCGHSRVSLELMVEQWAVSGGGTSGWGRKEIKCKRSSKHLGLTRGSSGGAGTVLVKPQIVVSLKWFRQKQFL